MKKIYILLVFVAGLVGCKESGKSDFVLPTSTGNTNKIMVVMKGTDWIGKPGDEIRTVFGEHQVGLPQPETLLSVGQVDPSGFKKFMKRNKAILMFQKADKEDISIIKDKYAAPQVIIIATAKDEAGMIHLIRTRGKEIIEIFNKEDVKFVQNIFKKESIDHTKLKVVKKLGIDIIIPERYRLVDDKDNFLWMRQHLMSGIALSLIHI